MPIDFAGILGVDRLGEAKPWLTPTAVKMVGFGAEDTPLVDDFFDSRLIVDIRKVLMLLGGW